MESNDPEHLDSDSSDVDKDFSLEQLYFSANFKAAENSALLNGFGKKESTPASMARNPASPLQLAEEQMMGSRRLLIGMYDD